MSFTAERSPAVAGRTSIRVLITGPVYFSPQLRHGSDPSPGHVLPGPPRRKAGRTRAPTGVQGGHRPGLRPERGGAHGPHRRHGRQPAGPCHRERGDRRRVAKAARDAGRPDGRPSPAAPPGGRRLSADLEAAGEHAAHRLRRHSHQEDPRMTIAYFDCFAGISGDMTLGALIDAGAERALLDATIEALRLGDEVSLQVGKETRGHVGGTRVRVETVDRAERTVPALRAVVDRADAPDGVKGSVFDA